VVVIGRGEHVNRTITYFADRKRLGYIPVLAAIDSVEDQPLTRPVPIIKYADLFGSNQNRFLLHGINTALVDVPAISEFLCSGESKSLARLFRRMILVSDLDWIDGASMQVEDFEGMIGIGVEKGLLTPMASFLKRALDVVIAVGIGILLLPVVLAAGIWIKLDSKGPLFYVQERLGKDRRLNKRPGDHWRKIRVYKFRSMVCDADSALNNYLQTHPSACQEWETNRKLVDDPRVTGAGRLLRKFSIDELPQLWNVLKGEMSLVGPRPLPPDHYSLLSSNLRDLRATLRPGLTGMWQVSGRSNSGTAGMEMWDAYYIYNWSPWLDIYILLRTVWVVLNRNGAY
jgi:Undecaprenyl-phosphate galactose phosphotransferase WbaP